MLIRTAIYSEDAIVAIDFPWKNKRDFGRIDIRTVPLMNRTSDRPTFDAAAMTALNERFIGCV